jgi:hypothetical protein
MSREHGALDGRTARTSSAEGRGCRTLSNLRPASSGLPRENTATPRQCINTSLRKFHEEEFCIRHSTRCNQRRWSTKGLQACCRQVSYHSWL